MVGPSGSGKSTAAKKIADSENGVVLSTDDFFMIDGKYVFDQSKLRLNHKRNFESFKKEIEKRTDCIIIDNTNLAEWEYSPYVELAKSSDYEIVFVRMPKISVEEIMERQKNRSSIGKCVPIEVVRKQVEKFNAS